MLYVLSLIKITNVEYFLMETCKETRHRIDAIAKAEKDFAKFREIA